MRISTCSFERGTLTKPTSIKQICDVQQLILITCNLQHVSHLFFKKKSQKVAAARSMLGSTYLWML